MAQSATDAFFGYFAAATATYTHIAGETLCAMADAAAPAEAAKLAEKPKSWYRPPPPSMREQNEPTSFPMMFNPWFSTGFAANDWSASPAMPSAFTAWPAAMSLISAGVPRCVAWPLAEANTATQDCSALAVDAWNDAFASYRSTGGHANANVIIEVPTEPELGTDHDEQEADPAISDAEDVNVASFENTTANVIAMWQEMSAAAFAATWAPTTSPAA